MTMKAAPEVNLGCDLSVVAGVGVGLKAYVVTVRWRACVPECGGKNRVVSQQVLAPMSHDPSIHLCSVCFLECGQKFTEFYTSLFVPI